MADRVGQRLSNYRLVQLLGQGHFTEVYLAEDVKTIRRVAIKVLDTRLDDAEVAQFLAQAQAIAELEHPHIVQILDFGVAGEIPFIVMDYAPHGTLRQLHPRGTLLPLSTVVSYVEQVASALAYVHEQQQLIHRDIKPHNMLLGPHNEVWVSDFDIAVVSESIGYKRLKTPVFEGTVPYASPEQLRGKPHTLGDQYSLAVVAYEWLSGDWPFHGSADEITTQHQIAAPPSLCEKNPAIPLTVEQVLMQALAKNPYERFESVLAFARALERASRSDRPATPGPLARSQFKSPLPLAPKPTPPVADAPVQQSTLLTYRGHSAQVTAVAWSPDGTRIASSSLDETVQVWQATTGHSLLTHRSSSLKGQAIAWSPDGRYIASTAGLSSETIQVWQTTSERLAPVLAATYEGHAERIRVLVWSPDGRYIASAGDDQTVHVWEADSKRHVFTYRGHSLVVMALTWSPDGTRIASAGEDKTVHTWEARTGGSIRIHYGHTDTVTSLAWSPAGTRIASASEDQTAQVWPAEQSRETASQHTTLIYRGHTGSVTGLAWSPDSRRVASCGIDETVHIWDATSGTPLLTYRGHSDWVSVVAWAPDGERIASASWDKTVQVWSPM
ncbi:MAG: serine/threonine protein kinase [Chloroflexota bacterium]|nr:serine/threonine protein kinase [Chloroflexota bacterium]